MPGKSTLAIGALKTATVSPMTSRMAVGLPYARVRYLSAMAGDETAPHFTPAEEPKQDGRAYTSKEGMPLYRPSLRVAQRGGDLPGPDVRFLKDAQGKVWVQFALEESPPAGLPANAEPFNVKLEGVQLRWKDLQGQARHRDFAEPTLVSTDVPEDATKSNFQIRVAVELEAQEVEAIHQALSVPASGAALQTVLSFGYWVDEPDASGAGGSTTGDGGATTGGATTGGGTTGGAEATGPRIRDHRRWAARPWASDAMIARSDAIRLRAADATIAGSSDATIAASSAAARAATIRGGLARIATLRTAGRLREIIEADRGRQAKPNFHSVKLERVVSFTFDPQIEANRRIYAAILGDTSLSDRWTDSGFGMIRRAAFPNTVYRLPDEIRLAFHTEMKAPYVIPNLYRTDQDEVRVRVSIGAMPWHDPQQQVKLRDFLRVSTGGELSSPSVVTGGYEEAKLRLTSAFPEEIRMLDGGDPVISLENGFQLTLDLSLEFYRFLAELLTRENSPGLTGEVAVRLESRPSIAEGTPPTVLERRVPVRLSFDDLAGLPLEVRLPQDLLSPLTIEIANLAPGEIEIGGCIPRLLQYDANSVAPLEVYEASSEGPAFPARIAGQGSLTIQLKPKVEHEELWWNAVQAELTTLNLVEPAGKALERIHELIPSAALAWKVAVECPVFRQTTIPESLQNLFRLKVKVFRPGFAPEHVVLGKETPEAEVSLGRSLSEVLGSDAARLATFRYQVQNIYFDHEGKWSEEKEGEGTSLFAFPNPVEGD